VDTVTMVERIEHASPVTRTQIERLLEQDADDRAWAEQIGPVYRQSDVARLLCKSKQAVSADARLLKLELRSGEVGYPVVQFDGRRQLPGVREVVEVLAGVVTTPWTIASWLTSPADVLGGVTPVAALRKGRTDEVLAAARRFAHAAVA
jgi:hypothetical protein